MTAASKRKVMAARKARNRPGSHHQMRKHGMRRSRVRRRGG